MQNSNFVTIIEVGPRDGLQNESTFVPTEKKVELINLLIKAGITKIEVGSFVSPKRIPQFIDTKEVLDTINSLKISKSVLVPNERGMQEALKCQIDEIAIFTAASETFNQRNIHCSIAESIERFKPVVSSAKSNKIRVRAYISCVLGCPYEGAIKTSQVMQVVTQLLALGVDEISFGDTIGVGTPKQTKELIADIQTLMPNNQIAMHFHDTYGEAIANIYASIECDIRKFDSAVAGLGGCPYARGATGNVATEDVLYLMHGLGMETNIDIFAVVRAGEMICNFLDKKNQSRVANALLVKA